MLLTQLSAPDRFGIVALGEKQIVSTEEKPKGPQSNYAVVGCYMYDQKVFDLIDGIEPSARGELEITAVNNLYVHCGELEYGFVEGRWTDAGTFESLEEANHLLLGNQNPVFGPRG